jgi:hypothetical protein
MKINKAYKILGVMLIVALSGTLGGTVNGQQRLKITFPQVDWSSGWAAGCKVGTLGPGVEGIKSVNGNWNARVGFSFLPFNINRQLGVGNLNLDIQAKSRIGGINLQGDFFFKPWFYFTGGLMVNLAQSSIKVSLTDKLEYGDIIIKPEDIGDFTIRMRQGWPVSPFLGIGFGNAMPVNRRVWFNIEMGAMYHGKPSFRLSADRMISPTANAENEIALKNAFKGYRFYPLFSAQVNYLIR